VIRARLFRKNRSENPPAKATTATEAHSSSSSPATVRRPLFQIAKRTIPPTERLDQHDQSEILECRQAGLGDPQT